MKNLTKVCILVLIFYAGCTRVSIIKYCPDDHSKEMPCVYSLEAGDSRVYLIENDSGLVMVDTGWPGKEQEILEAIRIISGLGSKAETFAPNLAASILFLGAR